MNKKFIKYFLVPGALGLTLVWQVQSSYASENNGQAQATISEPSQNQVGEDNKNNQAAPTSKAVLTNNSTPTTEGENKSGEQNDVNKGNDTNQPTKLGQAENPKKENEDKKLVIKELPNEDENHNKNYQDHPIANESTDKYKFEKGKELSKEEIDKEFAKYKENASQFAKVQKYIPELKALNLMDLKEGDKSVYYQIDMGNGNSFYSPKGFKIYTNSNRMVAVDLATDKVIELTSYKTDQAYVYKKLVGGGSDDIIGNASKSYGAYTEKVKGENGEISYKFYEGSKPSKEDLDKIKKVLATSSSALLDQLGEKYYDKVVDRAYQAALVNSYLAEHRKDISEADRKNIVDYVYRFGMTYKSDELNYSKSENNGYVDVSPIGYAKKTDKGTYKYKYQLSFNSITSNDKYSSTRLDIYAPTMAQNLKFKLTGVQEYEEHPDGTYTYKHKDVDVNLEIASTKDKATRDLLKEDWEKTEEPKPEIPQGDPYCPPFIPGCPQPQPVPPAPSKYVDESVWNNKKYKHGDHTFSIPYFNDIKDKKTLKNKIVELDKFVGFGKEEENPDKVIIDENKYDPNSQNAVEDGLLSPETNYRHFRLVNPQSGGPITLEVEFEISEDQVKKSPNMPLGARMLNGLAKSDPTAFNFTTTSKKIDYSSSRPGYGTTSLVEEKDLTKTGDARQDTINEIIRKTYAEGYATIFDHPELIKPGAFDINGLYANAGGGPSEYTGDKEKIGLKIGKSSFGFASFIEGELLKDSKSDKNLEINMRTSGASSSDIGVQIANGYGRYGDYREKSKINEDDFITNLMDLKDIKIKKSNKLIKEAERIDATLEFSTGGKLDLSKLEDWQNEFDKKFNIGNGAKNLISDNIMYGPSGAGMGSFGHSNASKSRGGIDVTPVGKVVKNKDGSWKYEYQISLMGINPSDHTKSGASYNIILPKNIKNVEFTLVGNNGYVRDRTNSLSELQNLEEHLNEKEKALIDKVKEALKKKGVNSNLETYEVLDIIRRLSDEEVYEKNEKLDIEDWSLGDSDGKFISSLDEITKKYEECLKRLDFIPDEVYAHTSFGNTSVKSKADYKAELKAEYKRAMEDAKKQEADKKEFLTADKLPSYFSPADIGGLKGKYIFSDFKGVDFKGLLEKYQDYYQNKKYEELGTLDPNSPNYKKDYDAITLKYNKIQLQVDLSKDSWFGAGNLYNESKMADYTDIIGDKVKLITKRGYTNGNPGIKGKANLANMNVYTFSGKDNNGPIGLRVTFDVDDDVVRKSPFMPVDVRNAWMTYTELPGISEKDGAQYLLDYNHLADRYVNKDTGEAISQIAYKNLSESEKASYYPTNYYYVEHPEKIKKEMFDIHGLHAEPSANITAYTGRWQEIGEDIGPWGDNLRAYSFEAYFDLGFNNETGNTFTLGMNEDYRDIGVNGLIIEEPPQTPPEKPPVTPPETPPETPPVTPPETPPEEPPEIPPETPEEEPPIPTRPKNPKTGISGMANTLAILASSLSGLFAMKKRKK